MNQFLCVQRDIHTENPWKRPSKGNLFQWFHQLNNRVDLSDFELYLSGNFAEQLMNYGYGKTWDVDIILNGKINNLDKLKNIFKQSILLGWENNLLIDIFYSSLSVKNYSAKKWIPHYRISYSSTFYKKRKDEIIDKNYEDIYPYTYVCDNGLIFIFLLEQPEYYKKYKKRVSSNHYSQTKINLRELCQK